MVVLLFGGNSSSKGVSSFQAFAIAISGRIGTGNIADVATAIAMGRPGAVFWMWRIRDLTLKPEARPMGFEIYLIALAIDADFKRFG